MTTPQLNCSFVEEVKQPPGRHFLGLKRSIAFAFFRQLLWFAFEGLCPTGENATHVDWLVWFLFMQQKRNVEKQPMQPFQKEKDSLAEEPADIYTFKREDGRWYIHLAEYLQHGWSKHDLQMMEGAHKFLNRMANGAKKVRLRLGTAPLENADLLELIEVCEAPRGGGIYHFFSSRNSASHSLFWICDLALLVFGDVPPKIYVQRLEAVAKQETSSADYPYRKQV